MECNCKEGWETKCKYRSNSLKNINDEAIYIDENGWVVENKHMRIYYDWGIYAEIFKDYFGAKKDDEILLKLLIDNYKGNCCYDSISLFLTNIIKGYYEIDEEDLKDCIMSYLYYSYGEPSNRLNILRMELGKNINKVISIKKFKISNKVDIREKYKFHLCKRRIGQEQLRKDALIYYDCKCMMCKVDDKRLLNASHIKTFAKSEKEKSRNVFNVLLLCDKHDGVFNCGLISFDDDGKIMISNEFSEKNRKELQVHEGMKIELEQKHKEFLKWHREHIFKR